MSESLALEILGRLADRIERQPERQQRVIERLPERSFLLEERKVLHETLERAAALGAVALVWGRHDLAHLIQKIVLTDAEKLYAFLGREPAAVRAASSSGRLREALEAWHGGRLPDYAEALVGDLERAWGLRKRPYSLGPEDWTEARDFLKGAIAIKENPEPGLDLRSFSRRTTGDSKLLERQRSRIAGCLSRIDALPDYLSDPEDIFRSYGLEKFAPAMLAAGPLTLDGAPLAYDSYIGLSPETAARVGVRASIRAILTIENLASFNRQVREARGADDLVLFSGGFPSRRALALFVRLAGLAQAPVYHWGDIDAGGIQIAHHLHRHLPQGLSLHCMTPEIALTRGTASPPLKVGSFPADSPVAGLAAFLGSQRAHTLEQEEIDPQALD